MELMKEIEEIEGVSDSDSEYLSKEFTNPNDLNEWRKLIYKYKDKSKRLKELTQIKDNLIKKYDEAIEKKEWELEHLKTFMVHQLELSDFDTKSGGKKIDQFPDLGTFSVSKKIPKFETKDDQYFINMGFARTYPEEIKVDKKALNDFLKTCHITDDGKVVDSFSGEVFENITVKYDSRVSFKESA